MERRIQLTEQQYQIWKTLMKLKDALVEVAEDEKNMREILLRAFWKCCEQSEIFDDAQLDFLDICEEFIIPCIDNE